MHVNKKVMATFVLLSVQHRYFVGCHIVSTAATLTNAIVLYVPSPSYPFEANAYMTVCLPNSQL